VRSLLERGWRLDDLDRYPTLHDYGFNKFESERSADKKRDKRGEQMDNNVWSTALCVEQPPVIADRVAALSCSQLVSGLSESIRSRIASTATRRTVGRRESLFIEKEKIKDLILLESGIVKHTQGGPNGSEVLLRICGPGEIIAGPGFSGISRHRYSARAIVESTILSWRDEDMRSYMRMYPTFATNINQILSGSLKDLETRIREFAFEEPARRVALLLIRLCKKMGRSTEEGIRIAITQSEIAQTEGLSVFTVSRILSRWSGRGLVLTRRQAVIVTDVRRLARRNDTAITRNEAR
jgi:CRP-like cAMP-binding protein